MALLERETASNSVIDNSRCHCHASLSFVGALAYHCNDPKSVFRNFLKELQRFEIHLPPHPLPSGTELAPAGLILLLVLVMLEHRLLLGLSLLHPLVWLYIFFDVVEGYIWLQIHSHTVGTVLLWSARDKS